MACAGSVEDTTNPAVRLQGEDGALLLHLRARFHFCMFCVWGWGFWVRVLKVRIGLGLPRWNPLIWG